MKNLFRPDIELPRGMGQPPPYSVVTTCGDRSVRLWWRTNVLDCDVIVNI